MFVLVLFVGSILVNSAVAESPADNDVYYPYPIWSNPFDWKIFKEYGKIPQRNVLISPISLKMILSLLYQGSAGITQKELEDVLDVFDQTAARTEAQELSNRLQVRDSSDYGVFMGTRVFLDNHLQPQQKFSSIANEFYKSEVTPVNFSDPVSASANINSWAKEITKGRIPKLIDPVDLDEAIMVAANAVYFKGAWRYPFANRTFEDKFYVGNGDTFYTITTQFMSTKDRFYVHDSVQLDAKILRLPYKGGKYSMFIILPNSKGGLSSLINRISLASVHSLLYMMDKQMVEVKLPKFKFDFQARFSKTLQDLGLTQMFQNTASFSGIVRGNNTVLRKLVVSDIIQKSGIEINEHGSVIYAASELSIGNKFGENDVKFEATHPFMFFIEEQQGSLLFMGKVENPLNGEVLPLEPKPAKRFM
ncbi:unnamed protein product [Phyllotreta striolata]|uniref:Serpin domain-containing protein n=1 Tax=Phyllotreta striolata TaxID=444603 RepID=A0A9N9TPH2_PHYSR|nr:unnamed protein product [Phyllotreta striolata]